MARIIEETFAGLLVLVLAVAYVQALAAGCALAYASDVEASFVAADSDELRSQALEAGDTFVEAVEGVDLVFQVVDAEELTVRLGTGEECGNGFKGGFFPASHTVTVPASVTNGGFAWTVVAIADRAFEATSESDYVSVVRISSDLGSIGTRAFCGWRNATPFSLQVAEGVLLGHFAVDACSYTVMDELVFPEGSTVTASDDANLNGTDIASVVYPLSHNGTILCNQSNLK